ncbi:MAG: PaaI family thioesterase [Oscillospiraceae bacterium]|jgi:acyl-CoA thioesterase|nr:PaaI family thioesterase [Oscillospiraceae bacterium]
MPTLEEIRETFSNDRFAAAAGIEILEAAPHSARCSMELTAMHKNARGTVMGGAVFTLADFAVAVAANAFAQATATVTQQADIAFLSAAKGNTLFAQVQCLKAGRSTAYYSIDVHDELGTYVAQAHANCFVLSPR